MNVNGCFVHQSKSNFHYYTPMNFFLSLSEAYFIDMFSAELIITEIAIKLQYFRNRRNIAPIIPYIY